MWKDAQKELYDMDCYENEHGFILYKLYEDNSCYMKLIYLKKEHRGSGLALKLYKELCSQLPSPHIIGTVDTSASNSEKNLQIYLNLGAKILSVKDTVITLQIPKITE